MNTNFKNIELLKARYFEVVRGIKNLDDLPGTLGRGVGVYFSSESALFVRSVRVNLDSAHFALASFNPFGEALVVIYEEASGESLTSFFDDEDELQPAIRRAIGNRLPVFTGKYGEFEDVYKFVDCSNHSPDDFAEVFGRGRDGDAFDLDFDAIADQLHSHPEE